MLPVGGVEDKQELITLGVTGCLVPRPGSAAPALDFYKDFCFRYLEIFRCSFVWPLLLDWKDIGAMKEHNYFVPLARQCCYCSGNLLYLFTHRFPILIYLTFVKLWLLVTLLHHGNDHKKQNMCEVVLCWPSGDCNNASLSVWFALPITQNMVIDQPPKKYICKDICTDLSIKSFSWCALPIRDAFWTFGRDFRPLWRHLLGYYEICSPFWTWVWPPPPLEQCEKLQDW